MFNTFLGRKDGASWKEALAACQDIMNWYGGATRYETLIKAGIAQMQRLRTEALKTLSAKNNHELMHCLSALNLMDVGQSSMLSALQRKESRRTMRENFIRVDYPDEDAEMNKLLIQKLNHGQPEFSWREPRPVA